MTISIYHRDKTDVDEETLNWYKEIGISHRVIENEDGTVTMKFTVPYRGNPMSLEYVLDVEANKCKAMDLIMHEAYRGVKLEAFYVFERADKLLTTVDGKSDVRVARIIVDDKGDIFAIFGFCIDDVDGVRNVTMEREHSPRYYLTQDCEWLKNKMAALSKKYLLLRDTDSYDSISYLEAQVDLLTKLVIKLYDAMIDGKSQYVQEDECVTMLREANEHSVLNIKSKEAILKEFNVNKAKFREMQEKYYESLS